MTHAPLTTDASTDALIEAGRASMSLSYNPQPVVFVEGRGARVTDREGREYLDFLAGIAVNTLGHSHPALIETLKSQLDRLVHVSNAYWTEPQIGFQQRLAEHTFADRVYPCNSGAEANEAALKLARRYQRVVREQDRYEFITFEKSFHGRTMGAISATGQPKYHAGFEPLVPGFHYAPWGDADAVRSLVNERTAAILVEPVQGEGGVRPAEPAFLAELRRICDEHGLVLIFDEVQCGVGRTGSLFAYQHYGVEPDIMTLAKGIGGGVPLGAMVARAEVAEGFTRGSHASTYGGNPLATAAGCVVLDEVLREGFLDHVTEMGERLRDGLRSALGDHPRVVDVRGLGLMNGVELDATPAEALQVVHACREDGLLLNTAGGTVVRMVPPLIVTADDVDLAIERLAANMGALDASA